MNCQEISIWEKINNSGKTKLEAKWLKEVYSPNHSIELKKFILVNSISNEHILFDKIEDTLENKKTIKRELGYFDIYSSRIGLSFGVTFCAMFLINCLALVAAFLYPSTIIVGWTSCSKSDSACSNSAPARTTTDVVPSPTSLSVDFEISTSIFAAGC